MRLSAFGAALIMTSIASSAQDLSYTHDSAGNLQTVAPSAGNTVWDCGPSHSVCSGGRGKCQMGQCVASSVCPTGQNCPPGPDPEPYEYVECEVFGDGDTNRAGPSDAIYISGRTHHEGDACVPAPPDPSTEEGTYGLCRKWFGRCRTVNSNQTVRFRVFDDGYSDTSSFSDAVYIPKSGNQACIPDGTSTGTCRRWFGRAVTQDGRGVQCRVFEDGYRFITHGRDAIYIPSPIASGGSACVPGGDSGICRRWFGKCSVQDAPPEISAVLQYLYSRPASAPITIPPVHPRIVTPPVR